MLPDGFVNGREKTDNRILSGPVIKKVGQRSRYQNKNDTDDCTASQIFHKKYPINSICSYLWGIRYLQITLIEERRAIFYFSENLKTERAEEGNEKIKRGKSARGTADYNQY